MKTNIFNIKEKKEKKIILEEERTKNPFLLFLKRHRNFILVSIIMTLFCLILVSTGIALSLFQGSNDYDISYIEGDSTIDSNNDPEIDDEEVEDELLGEIAREEGILLLVKTIMSPNGDVIYYYTDGTSVIVQANGKIYRVSTNESGEYGVKESGKIDSTAKRILVTSTTSTLVDGTIITYYSDGSAKVEYNNQSYFIRDSNNIKLNNGTSLNNLAPSGVAPTKEIKNQNNNMVITFTDKTSLVIINDEKYIVNRNTDVTVTDTKISYDKNNAFSVIQEETYKDGNRITHFQNGSAIITTPDGNITYVKKSGDLLLKKNKLYEILPNPTGESNSRSTLKIANDKRVTYFDNSSAVIINSDDKREYVEDSDEVIYDNNKNITSKPIIFKQVDKRITKSDNVAYLFDNGKAQVIRENGTSYITDASRLEFKPKEEEKPEEEEKPSHNVPDENPGEGIVITEAENVYKDDFKNYEITKFEITNNNKTSRVLRIVIEEVPNYKIYNTTPLDPKFVKFQATIFSDKGDDTIVKATRLTDKEWKENDKVKGYIIYEGTINAKDTQRVSLDLYVDYYSLTNEEQDKGFIGTIKIYVDDSFLDKE